MAIDIGNTNVHIGVSRAGDSSWDRVLRFSPDSERPADEWHALISAHLRDEFAPAPESNVICCSVVPRITSQLSDFVSRYWGSEMAMVTAQSNLQIRVGTDRPAETGADRIANAEAAFRLFGGPVIIVDAGTATKVDAVTQDGRFVGGAIAPGLGLGMEALARRAAQLYAVPLEVPEQAIGTNTIHAVQSGLVLGHVKMIDGLVSQVSDELGGAETVVLTGGHSSVLREHLTRVKHLSPNLALDGLRFIAQDLR